MVMSGFYLNIRMAVSIGTQSLRHLLHIRLDIQELPDKRTMALYGPDSNLLALRGCPDQPLPLLRQVLCLVQPNSRGR